MRKVLLCMRLQLAILSTNKKVEGYGLMRRTKQWWDKLTKAERSELTWLERGNSSHYSAYYGKSSRMPEDCIECPDCNTPHTGVGLCPKCNQRLNTLINKANNAMKKVDEYV